MQLLKDFPDTQIFYYGTIIVLKDTFITPKGTFDGKYCMIGGCGGMGNFQMLDVHRSIGSCIIHDLAPNVPGHHGVNKEGIKTWADEHFKLFYTSEGYQEYSSKIDEIVYIDFLDNYFKQTNRDLFL